MEVITVPIEYVLLGLIAMVLAALLTIATKIAELWDRLRTKPPLHQQYVGLTDCASNRAGVGKRIDSMEASIKTLVDEIRQDRKEQALARRGIHRRVNKVLFGLAQLQGKMGINSGDLANEADD